MKKRMPETLEWKNGRVAILDQTAIPFRVSYISCGDYGRVAKAIRDMEIRGAPAIGVAGAMGLALGALKIRTPDKKIFFSKLKKIARELISTRPTGYNLRWAVERVLRVAVANGSKPLPAIKKLMAGEAIKIKREDAAMNRQIGSYGAKMIKKGSSVLTHCNAGALATGGYGTALGVIRTAFRQGRVEKVFVDETRPRLQGARLTAFELKMEGIPAVLISDSMAGWLMQKKQVQAVIVGADRIASNGDTANKIGTYALAVLANHHKVPFYVAAPGSTIDFGIASGRQIIVEERAGSEVSVVNGKPITCEGMKVFNPSFDVTPHELITAIITEKGVVKKPDRAGMERIKA